MTFGLLQLPSLYRLLPLGSIPVEGLLITGKLHQTNGTGGEAGVLGVWLCVCLTKRC